MCMMLSMAEQLSLLVSWSLRSSEINLIISFPLITAELLVNDTAHLKPLQVVTIQNTSNKTQTYKITHVPAGTTTSFDSDQFAIDYPVPLTTKYAKVTILPSTLTLKPGAKGAFAATILPPSGVDPKVFPVYSGFINVASATEQVHVAYLGVAASMKDMKILDTTDICQLHLPVLSVEVTERFPQTSAYHYPSWPIQRATSRQTQLRTHSKASSSHVVDEIILTLHS